MSGIFKYSLIVAAAGLVASQAFAADLKWSGEYRAEGAFIRNYTMSSGDSVEDSYLTNHLIMKPEIIAADGLKVESRFDIFNNALGNNTIGQVMGNYAPVASGTQAYPPSTGTTTLQDETLAVTELYMNWVNEFSQVTIGRVPFNFGLGMKYSSGQGIYDHFHSTKDIVAYTLVMGNLSVMPAYGKVREGALTREDDTNDYIVKVQYDNAESDLSLGVLFDNRVAPLDSNSPAAGNDFPASYFSGLNPGFGAAAIYDGYNAYDMNFFVKKKSDNFTFGAEVGFENGYTGVQVLDGSGNLQHVNISGFGVATESDWKLSSLDLNLKLGMASGDDPDTANFEGYFFHPNYDIAMLMFNYPLGRFDVNRTTLAGSRLATVGQAGTSGAGNLNGLDTEVISNAIYLAPSAKWAMGEHYDLNLTLAYAQQIKASVSPSQGGSAAALGYEADLGFTYHPSDKFSWTTTLGGFKPGQAFQGTSAQNFPTDMVYGATSKAAISF